MVNNPEKIIILILTLVFSFGQILRLTAINEVVFHLNDLLIGLLVLFWLIKKIINKSPINLDGISKSAFLFILTALISLLTNILNYQLREILISGLYPLRWTGYLFIYIILLNEKVSAKIIINSILLSIFLISLLGLSQYLFFPDLTILALDNWDPHLYRLTAPFFDPTFTGAILVSGLIFIINIYWNQKKPFYFWLICFLIYIAASLTYSRAVYLFYFISVLIISLVKKSPKFFLSLIFIGILTLLVLPKQKSYGTKLDRRETLFARVENWKQSLIIFKNQPIFGSGFNTYRYTQKKYGFLTEENYQNTHSGGGADSSLLFILATTGIVGLLAYLNLLRQVFKKTLIDIKNPLNLSLFAILIGLLAHSIFTNSLFYPWIMEIIWIEAALLRNKN